MEKIYILLPVHNNIEMTVRFVNCLSAQTFDNYHLVLIDDGSTDGTSDMVRRRIKSVTVLKGSGDWWWGGSLHRGYLWAKKMGLDPSSVVLIMNNDTEFEKDFLENAMKLLDKSERSLFLARSLDRDTKEIMDAGVKLEWRPYRISKAKRQDEINCLSTRGLFMRMSDFIELGGFYPKILPHYWSDYEFTIRAARSGMKLLIDPSLDLYINEKNTGFREFNDEPVFKFIAKLFSRRSTLNPVDRIVFIMLSCPSWKYKILNSLDIVWMSLKMIMRQALGRKA